MPFAELRVTRATTIAAENCSTGYISEFAVVGTGAQEPLQETATMTMY
jgi:hypothetical protein